MLPANLKITLSCCILFFLFPTFCAINEYRVNLKRKDDDPKKRNYSPLSPWLIPITFPIMILVSVFVLILESLLGAAVLIIFPISLIFFRKLPESDFFLTKWFLKLGRGLLSFNTEMLRIVGLYSSPG